MSQILLNIAYCVAVTGMLFSAIIVTLVLLAVLTNPRQASRNLRLWWRHRKDDALYENIWRRPDGVVVDDNGKPLSENMQKIHIGRGK